MSRHAERDSFFFLRGALSIAKRTQCTLLEFHSTALLTGQRQTRKELATENGMLSVASSSFVCEL
jgi:hypothetical protein